jgi:hypothetical protein
MHHVKMSADVVDVARRAADRWYVTVGDTAVGPVNLDLLARGVEAGKVPLEAFVRHEQWKVWRPLAELAEIEQDSASSTTPQVTDDIDDGAPSLPGAPRSLPSHASSDQREALLLLMTAAVVRGGADAALVHEVGDWEAVVVCAHGAATWEAVGMRTPLADPAVVAAASGATLVAEPEPGPAGASVMARLARVAGPVEGAVLIPIRVRDRLYGMIEMGRRTPFRAAEIASLEGLVEALVLKLEQPA